MYTIYCIIRILYAYLYIWFPIYMFVCTYIHFLKIYITTRYLYFVFVWKTLYTLYITKDMPKLNFRNFKICDVEIKLWINSFRQYWKWCWCCFNWGWCYFNCWFCYQWCCFWFYWLLLMLLPLNLKLLQLMLFHNVSYISWAF